MLLHTLNKSSKQSTLATWKMKLDWKLVYCQDALKGVMALCGWKCLWCWCCFCWVLWS